MALPNETPRPDALPVCEPGRPGDPEALARVCAELPDDEVLYDLAELFRVFGDTTRIKILYALFESELCVSDIAQAVGLPRAR